jgi:hypothetical protein
MSTAQHNRPDGSECPYLATIFCNKCGWHDPIVNAGEGARRIAAERARQVTAEGWTPEHDREHSDGDLARAAVAYAVASLGASHEHINSWWPWNLYGIKHDPANPVRSLAKAGALIAAEIDRLLAAQTTPGATESTEPDRETPGDDGGRTLSAPRSGGNLQRVRASTPRRPLTRSARWHSTPSPVPQRIRWARLVNWLTSCRCRCGTRSPVPPSLRLCRSRSAWSGSAGALSWPATT